MSKGKFFELLDFPKFAEPSLRAIKVAATAESAKDRLHGSAFMSYGAMWPRIDPIVRGIASDDFIDTSFSFYSDDWKNESIRSAFRLLRDLMGGRGAWYRGPSRPIRVLGLWFKPSIKGVWFYEGQAYAVLINARKTQPLSPYDVRFLARGVHELHCIDDPNDPIPLIVDLSADERGGDRQLRTYPVLPEEAISLDEFEASVRDFLEALNLAGIALPPPPDAEHISDLFKR